MKGNNVKDTASRVLVSLYFVWLPVLALLLWLAGTNVLQVGLGVSRLLILFILLSFITGTALFAVIQLFAIQKKVSKIVLYTYCIMAVACITTVMLVVNNI